MCKFLQIKHLTHILMCDISFDIISAATSYDRDCFKLREQSLSEEVRAKIKPKETSHI